MPVAPPETSGCSAVQTGCKRPEPLPPDIDELAGLWPKLAEGDRGTLLALARSLAGKASP